MKATIITLLFFFDYYYYIILNFSWHVAALVRSFDFDRSISFVRFRSLYPGDNVLLPHFSRRVLYSWLQAWPNYILFTWVKLQVTCLKTTWVRVKLLAEKSYSSKK